MWPSRSSAKYCNIEAESCLNHAPWLKLFLAFWSNQARQGRSLFFRQRPQCLCQFHGLRAKLLLWLCLAAGHCLYKSPVAHLRINTGSLGLAMAKGVLDQRQVPGVLKEISSERMAQGMRCLYVPPIHVGSCQPGAYPSG